MGNYDLRIKKNNAIDNATLFYYSRTMEIYHATEVFSSLSQETRLRVFKLLIEYGCDGLVPGSIAKKLKIPDNTLSFHLAHMSKAGLVSSKKSGRSVTYFANTDYIEELMDFMRENCCTKENLKNKKSNRPKEREC